MKEAQSLSLCHQFSAPGQPYPALAPPLQPLNTASPVAASEISVLFCPYVGRQHAMHPSDAGSLHLS